MRGPNGGGPLHSARAWLLPAAPGGFLTINSSTAAHRIVATASLRFPASYGGLPMLNPSRTSYVWLISCAWVVFAAKKDAAAVDDLSDDDDHLWTNLVPAEASRIIWASPSSKIGRILVGNFGWQFTRRVPAEESIPDGLIAGCCWQ